MENYRETPSFREKESLFAINKTGFPTIFFVKSGGYYVRINLSDLVYIESDNNYITLFVNTGKRYMLKKSISAVQAVLDNNLMIRVHRSYLINVLHLEKFSFEEVTINGIIIPIGKTYQKGFLDRMFYSNQKTETKPYKIA